VNVVLVRNVRGVDEEATIRHIRESHDMYGLTLKKDCIVVVTISIATIDCPRVNGHGCLLGTFDRALDHLETSHDGVYGMI
jgi:hypothetical protein